MVCVLWTAKRGTQKGRSKVCKDFKSWIRDMKNLCFLINQYVFVYVHTYSPSIDGVCICECVYYIIQSTASIQRTAVIRVLNSSECSDIPNWTGRWKAHENDHHQARLMASCWDYHEHGRKELPGACIEPLPRPDPSVPGIWKPLENPVWIFWKFFVWTMPSAELILRHKAAKI